MVGIKKEIVDIYAIDKNRNEYNQKIGTRFTSGNKTNYLERESSPPSRIFNGDENHIYGEY